MRNIISLAMVLFSTSVFAATGSGNVSNVLTLGGISQTDNLNVGEANSQGYFTVYSNNFSVTANQYANLYKNGLPYQVPVGKTFKIVKYCGAASAGTNLPQLITATAPFADNAASITGGVRQSGVASGSPFSNIQTSGTYQCFNATWDAAASTYLGFQSTTTASYFIMVTGKEI